MKTLEQVGVGRSAWVECVGGARAFRRRMMELGLLPGTAVEVVRIAPLGDPMELRVRGCALSIRAAQAREVGVRTEAPTTDARTADMPADAQSELSSVAAQ